MVETGCFDYAKRSTLTLNDSEIRNCLTNPIKEQFFNQIIPWI